MSPDPTASRAATADLRELVFSTLRELLSDPGGELGDAVARAISERRHRSQPSLLVRRLRADRAAPSASTPLGCGRL